MRKGMLYLYLIIHRINVKLVVLFWTEYQWVGAFRWFSSNRPQHNSDMWQIACLFLDVEWKFSCKKAGDFWGKFSDVWTEHKGWVPYSLSKFRNKRTLEGKTNKSHRISPHHQRWLSSMPVLLSNNVGNVASSKFRQEVLMGWWVGEPVRWWFIWLLMKGF